MAMAAMLFEAGNRDVLSSDAVLDVLLEVLKSNRNVEEVIADQQILSRRQRESVRQFLAEQCLNSTGRRQSPEASSRANTPAIDPDNPQTLASGVPRAQGSNVLPKPSEPASSVGIPSGAERYTAADEIGRGGWGVVVRAHDRQLERDVAVKKLSSKGNQDPEISRRFLHEAKITGQLQHPGIVPVYERGFTPDDQQPFYAMKLLEGVTLRDVIREYHGLPRGPQKRERFHSLLNSFVDVCHAVAYAHDRNIIHRDLKPSNVVVGRFGETVVVDWGLAKSVAEPTGAAEVQLSSEATLPGGRPLSANRNVEASSALSDRAAAVFGAAGCASDSSLTQQGSVIGTPAFMSPEQARGDRDEIDKRSDNYALGVILYVILTGRPPFHAKDISTTLKQVVDGQYTHPRAIDRRVPAPLASICVQAMARSKAERYQLASEIADDVLRYLANEAVSAHRSSALERLALWCRRRPVVAAVMIISTLVIGITGSAATAVVSAAHRNEKQARQEAVVAHAEEKEAREAAEVAEQQALQSLEESRTSADAWLIDLSGTLGRYPGLQAVRQDLIEKAKQHCQTLLASVTDDPDQQLEAARCLLRLGDLQLLTGDAAAAKTAFDQGVVKLQQVHRVDASSLCERELLNAEIGLAKCLIGEGQFKPETAEQLAKAVDVIRQRCHATIDVESQDSDECRNSIARACLVAGRGFQSIGQMTEAVRQFEEALNYAEVMELDNPDPRHQQLAAVIREDLSQAYEATGQTELSARVLKDHIEATSARLAGNVDRPDLLETRAIAHMRWANAERLLGDDWAAEGAYRQAVEDLSQSWRLMFGDHYFNENLAIAQANLGQMAIRLNQLEDAEQMLREAVDQLTGLLQAGRADRETASRLAACNVSLGHVLMLRGNVVAEDQIKRSLDIFDYLQRELTVTTADRIAHGQALLNLGRWYRLAGNQAAALENLQAAQKHFQQLAADVSEPSIRLYQVHAELDLAMVTEQAGDAAAAGQLRETAMESLAALSAGESASQRVASDSATCVLIRNLLHSQQTAEKVTEAVQLLHDLNIGPSSPAHLHQLAAIAQYRSGAFEQALQSIRTAISHRRYPDTTDDVIMGCITAATTPMQANEALLRIQPAAEQIPGDLNLQSWVSELEQLAQSADLSPTSMNDGQ